jgi:hypothetical protein
MFPFTDPVHRAERAADSGLEPDHQGLEGTLQGHLSQSVRFSSFRRLVNLEPILRRLNLQLQRQRCSRLDRFSK